MSTHFEKGVYLRCREGNITADRVTLLHAEVNDVQTLQEKYPHLSISVALHRKELKRASEWKDKVKECTLISHHGIALEKECRRLLEQGFKVRVALPARLELLRDLDLGGATVLDLTFDLMAFDFARPASGHRTQFHSPLFAWELPSISQTLDFLHVHGIAENRISLGLADFGVVYKNVHPGLSNAGYGQPCQGEQFKVTELSREQIFSYLNHNREAKIFYTATQGCFQSFTYNQHNGDWISFDDAKTLESKTAWALRRGLRGVFLYSL